MCGCPSHVPNWGSGLQPRHVPWLGIKLATLWFAGLSSIHWAIPARALCIFLMHFQILPQPQHLAGTWKSYQLLREICKIFSKSRSNSVLILIGSNIRKTFDWKKHLYSQYKYRTCHIQNLEGHALELFEVKKNNFIPFPLFCAYGASLVTFNPQKLAPHLPFSI